MKYKIVRKPGYRYSLEEERQPQWIDSLNDLLYKIEKRNKKLK